MFNNRFKFDAKQRYTIKKFKWGAASVLVGLSFMANSQQVLAEENLASVPTIETASAAATETETTETVASSNMTESTPEAAAVNPADATEEAALTPELQPEASLMASQDDAGAAVAPVEIQPTSVTVGITGQDRFGTPIADGSEVADSAILNFNLSMALPDRDIKAGDYINFELPNTLRTTPSPQTITITDASGVHVGNLVLTLNRDASGTYINTTGVLTFTDGYAGKIDNVLDLNFNVSNSSHWATGELEEMAVTINGTKYGTGTNLKVYRSENTVFGTSTRLWQIEDSGAPYTLYQQSEVAIVNPDEATYTTVVYTIDEDTLDYARYDVATIRSKGYEFLLGAARNSYQRVNTLNNDLGITAEVNDEGTKVTLKIPNMPAGFGLNGGSIPVLLSDKAIAEKYVQYYNSTMEVYINPVGSTFDEATDTPDRTRHGKNVYQFSGSSADSTTVNQVIVQHVDKNGNQLATRTVTEYKIGEAYTTAPVSIDGYELVETPANTAGSVTAGEPIFVRYVYDLKTTESTEEKTVTRTIEYVHEDGSKAAEPVTETLTFTRTVTTVDATGEKTYGEWTAPQTFKEVTSPSLENYTADKATVAEVTVSADATDITEKVIYSPVIEFKTETKVSKLTVNYHGAGDQTPESKVETVTWTRSLEINKATGEIISQTPWEAAQLVYNEVKSPVLENYTVDKETVVDQPVHETDVTVDVYYTPTSSETTETKTITRTIKYVDEAGKEVAPARVETLTFTRPVTTNDVTGEQTFGEWTSADDSFDEVSSPTVPNRVTDTPVVPSEVVTADASDKEVVVVYAPTSSETTETRTITRTIKYVDEAGNEVAPAKVETLTFTRPVTTNDVTGEQTFGEWTSADDSFDEVSSPTVPNRVTDTPVVASEVVTADASDKEVVVVYTPTSSETTETKTITRTIKYVDEAGNEVAPAKVETLTFTRPVTTNDVTGEQTFGEWTSVDDSYDEVASPTVPNRVTDTPVVASEVVTADASDKEVVVVYTPTSSEMTETKTITRTIKYVDEAGNELAPAVTQTVTYTRTVTTNDVTGEQTFGEWTSADDSFDEVTSPTVPNRVTDTPVVASEVVTADASDKEVVVVYTPTSSETTETKTITRTIKYVDEAGNEVAPSVTQTVTYTRTVKTNDVTGEKTYGEWMTTNKELPAVTSPEVAQHTTDRQVVEALATTAETADIEEVVVYKKQVQVVDQPAQPSRPNLPSQPAPAPKPEVPAKLDAATGAQAQSAPTQTLPKTGDTGEQTSLLGLAVLGLVSLASGTRKRRQED